MAAHQGGAAAPAAAAAELIGSSLGRLVKACGRDRKLTDVATAAKELQDQLGEVLSPEYATRVEAEAAAAAAAGAAAAPSPQQAGDGAPPMGPEPEEGGAEPAPEGAAPPGDEAAAGAPPPASEGGDAGPPPVADGAGAAAAAAAEGEEGVRAAEAKRDADKARLAAAAASLPLGPGGAGAGAAAAAPGAISDAAALAVLRVLRLAVATGRPPLVEVSLDLLHKLIALRFLQGAAHAVASDRDRDGEGRERPRDDGGKAAPTAAGSGAAVSEALAATPQAIAVELICRCDEIPDEGVEVLVLRGLLTAATSATFALHGQALLLAVRTCYNIHLMSRSEVNQTTAKASLTQMLNVVFQRMEADSMLVQVKPIAVADMLSIAKGGIAPADASGVTSAVQNFLNGVIGMTGYGGPSAQQQADALRSSVAAQFAAQQGDVAAMGSPAAAPAAQPPQPPPALALPEGAAGAQAGGGEAAAAAAAGAGGGVSGAGSETSEEDDAERFKLGGDAGGGDSGGGVEAAGGQAAGAGAAAAGGAQHGGGHHHHHGGGHHHHHHGGGGGGLLLKDAFLVFRALCKLSIRTSDSATVADPTAVRGKLLALELLKVLLENSGPTFRSSEKFTAAIRQYLCLSLLKNSASSIPAALQLSASIFLSLLQRFRAALKAEVGVFFPMILLKCLEPPTPGSGAAPAAAAAGGPAINSYSYKVVVLRCLREVCCDGQLLVDLFVNYDCDLDSSNLFERLVTGLVKMAQAPLPQGGDYTAVQQEQWLRQEALQCLSSASEALLAWYNAAARVEAGQGDDGSDDEDTAPAAPQSRALRSPTPTLPHERAGDDAAAPGASGGGTGGGAGGDALGGDALSRKRLMKGKWHEGVALFNKKPKKGIAFLQAEGMLGPAPEDIALFLSKTEGLDKVTVGDYLGEREDTALKVMHAYVDSMDFRGLEFDTAIRTFLQGFRLPGEAQKIDRLMEKFAARFIACNPGSFKSADVAYVLAYSVIMLNTDAHNPQVKNKMSCEGFIKNNRGINDGQDIDPDFMRALYERIVTNEIKMKDEAGPAAADSADAGGAGALLRNNAVMAALWSIVGGHKPHASSEPSDEAIRRTLDSLHERAKGATFVVTRESDTARPMLELIWAPLLGAFSLLFDEYSDPRLLSICLAGFAAAACLATSLGVPGLRDVFVSGLCNFTGLHSPGSVRAKNALAFRALLRVAASVGDGLEDRWLDILRCVSRWELLQQMASGTPTDAALFAAPHEGKGGGGLGGRAAAALKDQLRRLGNNGPGGGGAGGSPGGYQEGVKSMESLAMSEMSVKRGGGGGGGRDDEGLPPLEVISSVDASEIQAVYLVSARLDSDAVVAFVRALAAISQDELRDVRAPRVFSLTKIVEIAHFNMGRIRLVWGRIWAVLSEYFIAVGCHSNLAVAMYAVDSLRQLSMKFLERDELANYTFQNDFLRPFVVVMRQSQSIEIRELIIRCLSQMVLARVDNVKSGWKSMFMVFTTAAGDPDPTIVRLAFDTIERIVREHFGHITETEAATFTDCVNCLIAFTNNPHSTEVALNAIAFLRFCAMRLAEGLPASTTVGAAAGPQAQAAALQFAAAHAHALPPPGAGGGGAGGGGDDAVYYWFPLLAGLSELTFDPRQEIRYGALEVLFDTLRFHGGAFSEAFWCRIFERVLLPIFDAVRAEVTDTTTFSSERRRQQEDAWLYETCTRCLQHLVDLFGLFYPALRPMLPRLLALLAGFMARSHAALASVGAAAFARLVASCGPHMDEATWREVVGGLRGVVDATLPDAAGLVTPPARGGGGSAGDLLSPTLRAGGEQQQQQQQQQAGSGGGAGTPRPPYTLREGVGMRRLARFRVHAGVQLLLVQAMGEVYGRDTGRMPARVVLQLADALAAVGEHARAANTDGPLRRRIAALQAEDRVAEDRCVPDPPLLRQETEAAHAQLSLLLHVASGGSGDKHAALVPEAQQRLERLTLDVLRRFAGGGAAGDQQQQQQQQQAPGPPPGPPLPPASSPELAAFAPLVVSALRALGVGAEAPFRRQLPGLFPVLAGLVRCDHATPDVQRALGDLLLARVGPLLGAGGGGGGGGAPRRSSSAGGAGGGGGAAGLAAEAGRA
ncbi:MAG: hypothetical protein J3K34DRAFT_525495 [Monoraphidium minutum]|nr:MAG: hypothetical protein J3K34DRAFT_525495 [Monoraphidium minutum]